jgi:RNA polymerase sigma factor (TIGR02999 family)
MAGAPSNEPFAALVYDELRLLARRYLAHERPDHTFQPTDLVHEACARLGERADASFQDRAHFVATAARAMRSILVDHARAKLADKRGGGAQRVTLRESVAGAAGDGDAGIDVLALDDALERLARFDPRKAQIVELRFFGGRSIAETAEALGISHMTVSSDWRVARAWLAAELEPG